MFSEIRILFLEIKRGDNEKNRLLWGIFRETE